MVFEKITIFEPHLEGARFGPTVGEQEDAGAAESRDHVETREYEEESGGRSRGFYLIVASIAVSLIATALARRYLGEDDEEFEQFELDESVDESIEEPAE